MGSCFNASRTGMLDDHLLSAVYQYIFNTLAAALTKDAVPPIRDRTTRLTFVRRHSNKKKRDVGICLHYHGLPRDLVHSIAGFNYLRGHFFISPIGLYHWLCCYGPCDPEDKGTSVLRNVCSCTTGDTTLKCLKNAGI